MRAPAPRQIYFIRRADGTGPIKIGCSAWPTERVRDLGYVMGVELQLLAIAPGDTGTEADLHKKFADHRQRLGGMREWFEATPELLGLVAETCATGSIPTKALDDRDARIIERRRNGETLQSIGTEFGLTRERIRQIASAA